MEQKEQMLTLIYQDPEMEIPDLWLTIPEKKYLKNKEHYSDLTEEVLSEIEEQAGMMPREEMIAEIMKETGISREEVIRHRKMAAENTLMAADRELVVIKMKSSPMTLEELEEVDNLSEEAMSMRNQ